VVSASSDSVYEELADLKNFEKLTSRLDEDKRGDIVFEDEIVKLKTTMGDVSFKIEERTPGKCVKYTSVDSPIPLKMWVQVLPLEEEKCKMLVTLGVELNSFMVRMVRKPLEEGVEKVADVLSQIPYNEI